jgi:hypothetical protein
MDILEVIVHLSSIYVFLMMLYLIMELSWEESARAFQILISLSMPIWLLNAHLKWMKEKWQNMQKAKGGLTCMAVAACFWSYGPIAF